MDRRSFLTGLLAAAAAVPFARAAYTMIMEPKLYEGFVGRYEGITFRANRIVQSIKMAEDHLNIVERFKATASLHAQMEQRDDELRAFFEGQQWTPKQVNALRSAPVPPAPA